MANITQLSQLDLTASYSYADYLTWRINGAVELIKGRIQLMSPAPNVKHQRISWQLGGVLFNYFDGNTCSAFSAPFDVRLYDRSKSILANKDITTVVQPDLCVICDNEKLDEQGCNGAPDWIIEILSKGTAKKDVKDKHALYAESGVTEYWLIYPYEEVIHQFVLNDQSGLYHLHNSYAGDDVVVPYLFPNLAIDLPTLFKDV
jgi:Uma2 family endonuclease